MCSAIEVHSQTNTFATSNFEPQATYVPGEKHTHLPWAYCVTLEICEADICGSVQVQSESLDAERRQG